MNTPSALIIALALAGFLSSARAEAPKVSPSPSPAVVPAGPKTGTTAAAIGRAAPEWGVKDLDGKPRGPAEFAGKVVVLEWFNPGCPFVKKFYTPGKMQEWQRELTAKGVIWVTVASTKPAHPDHKDAAALKSWMTTNKAAQSLVLFDAEGVMARRYGAKVTPHMFVIGKDGTLVYSGAIDSVRSPKPADIAQAKPVLLNAVQAALDGKPVETPMPAPYGCGVKL